MGWFWLVASRCWGLVSKMLVVATELFVRNGPVGAHNFQTGVRRRKYKLDSTKKKFVVQIGFRPF